MRFAASCRWSTYILGLAVAACPLMIGCEGGLGRASWVEPFNGKDIDGWKTRHDQHGNAWMSASKVAVDPANAKQLVATPGRGVLVNGSTGRTCDIITPQEFGDCQVHIEFMVPQESNSGVYLMGNYEVQILDSFGKKEVTSGDCGGIYARWIDGKSVDGYAPRVNASKAPGEWQVFDIVFHAPQFDAAGKKIKNAEFVSVKLNGTLVHEHVSLNGPTRGSLVEEEKAAGPIMLQGDHGPVAFRNIRIRPLP